MQQIALMTICKGRLTLDSKLAPRSPTARVAIFTASISMDVLHRRLGHSGNPAVKILLAEGMVHGIRKTKGTEVEPCDACQLGKLTRPPHPPSPFLHNTTRPLQLVVMDLAGPVKPKSLGGRQYILNLFYVFTRFLWSILLKNKGEAAEKILDWLPVPGANDREGSCRLDSRL